MTIHSTLAVLMGSTALGSYAPLTVVELNRHMILAHNMGLIGPNKNVENTLLGLPAGDHIFPQNFIRHHVIGFKGLAMMAATWNSIVYAGDGILAGFLSQNILMVERNIIGYGYDYGQHYGGN